MGNEDGEDSLIGLLLSAKVALSVNLESENYGLKVRIKNAVELQGYGWFNTNRCDRI